MSKVLLPIWIALALFAAAVSPVSSAGASPGSGSELQADHDFGDIADQSDAVFYATRLEDGDQNAASAGDWRDYCFELSADRKVGLGLRQLDRNADLHLNTAGGDTVASSQAAGTASEWLGASLRAGEYCARVVAVDAGQNHFVFRYGTGSPDLDNLLPETESESSSGEAAVDLTAEFAEYPDTHDGTEFTAELNFDPEPSVSYLTLRDEALTATGATITGVSRLTPGQNDGWRVTVTPDSGHRGDVVVVLAATSSCDDQGAICTAESVALVTRVELTVPGPDSTQQQSTQTITRPTPQDDNDVSARIQDSDDKDGKDEDQGLVGPRQNPPSNDATLSALSVSPVDINGFAADVTSYETGVASTVTQATVTATANNSGATVAITPADAATDAGHQVNLSAGRNTVTVTVTAADGVATETYTVSVNRGVTAAYGWKAADDFDTLAAAGNADPESVWSDGTTMWVSDGDDGELYAYNLSTRARDSGKDFDTLAAAGNTYPRGIWSDGTTMWVADLVDTKVYAYNLSSKARDGSKDFNTLIGAGNTSPQGIWSDGATVWVADGRDSKLYAYNLSTKARDATKDFDALGAAGNNGPGSMWSDGTTMWVTDFGTRKIFAYNLSSKARDASKDFNTLIAAGNTAPTSMWSDGATVWVADESDQKMYSYNMPVSTDATLRSLVVSPVDVDGFSADRTSYEVGVGSGVAQATVVATRNHPQATVAITPADADPVTDGHQVDLTAGRNTVTITVTAQDTTTIETYTVSVNRGVDDDYGWKAVDDFDTLAAAGNEVPTGIWSDGTDMWVADWTDDKLYAYDLSTRARNANRDFNALAAAGNEAPTGVWSDGTTIWVADSDDEKLYAYNLIGRFRDSAEDFNTLAGAGNTDPSGVWSDGATMWVADSGDDKIYAYNLSTRARDSGKDFDTLAAAGNTDPIGIWSDGTTMWVADSADDKVYAYNLSTKARDSGKDFDTLAGAGNASPTGVWSDGATMWVADLADGKLYSYNMPVSTDATLRSLVVSPVDVDGFSADRTSYEAGVGSGVAQATVVATGNHPQATVEFDVVDAAPGTDGHQVALAAGRNEVTITVTAHDGSSTETYTVSVNRGVDDDYGWKAVDDFDALVAAGNEVPTGVWSNGATMWVADLTDDKIYAYDLSTRARQVNRDLTALAAAGNVDPSDIWSDGATMWVTDNGDDRIYAYDLSSGVRDTNEEFTTLAAAGNEDPTGLWSDGTTMWVADRIDNKIYAYNLSTKARDAGKDFDTLATDNNNPTGLWSDGVTMWVADSNDDKVFAYRMSNRSRDSRKEFDTLTGAGNGSPTGLWSDGTTMWVGDGGDGKLYSYNTLVLADATLRSLELSPVDIVGFDALRTSYTVGVDSGVARVTVAAAANRPQAQVAITPADADPVADGHQIDLTTGGNSVRVEVTAPDMATTMTYWVTVNQGVADAYGWKAGGDFDGLRAAGNGNPFGITSDGTTMWVVDWDDDTVYAYDMSTRARDASKDYDMLSGAHGTPTGLWTDGTTMWIADLQTVGTEPVVYAYDLASETRDVSEEFDTDPANEAPYGIFSDGTTMWVVDSNDTKIYAYNVSTKARDAAKDFDTLAAAGNGEVWGIWSDGKTMWVADRTDDKLYSYNMPLAEPAGLAAAIGDGSVALTWDDPGDSRITKYQWRRSSDGGNNWSPDWSDIPGSDRTTTAYTSTGLTNNTTYTFGVRAVSDGGAGPESRVAQKPNRLPAAPAGFEAAPADTKTVLRWNNPNDPSIDKYQYRYRLTELPLWSPDWTDIPDSNDTTVTYTQTGLTNDVSYTFEVRAVNNVGNGPESSDEVITNPVPDQPAGLTLVPGAGRATLSWDDPQSASITSYEVRYRVRSSVSWSAWRRIPGSGPSTISHTVTGLAPRTEYVLELRARNVVGPGPGASVEMTRPAAPSGLSRTPGDGRVALSWDDPNDAGILRYEFRYRVTATVPDSWTVWADIPGSGASTVTHTQTGLVNGTSYTFEVRAVNVVGAGAAAQREATPSLAPAAPTGLRADGGDRSAELTWDDPDDDSIETYQYRVSDDDGGTWSVWTDMAGSSADTISYTVEMRTALLTNMAEHLIEVRASRSSGPGSAASVRVTPLADLRDANDNTLLDVGSDSTEDVAVGAGSPVRWVAQAFRTGPHPLGYRVMKASVNLAGVLRDDRVTMSIHADANGRPGRKLYAMFPRYCCQNMNPLGKARVGSDLRPFDTSGTAAFVVGNTDFRTSRIIVPHLEPDTTYHVVATVTSGLVLMERRSGAATGDGTDHGWQLGGYATSPNGQDWTTDTARRLVIDVRGAPLSAWFQPVVIDAPGSVQVPADAPIGHDIATVEFTPSGLDFTVEADWKEPNASCLGRILSYYPTVRAPAEPATCLFTVEAEDTPGGTTVTVRLNHELDCGTRTRYIVIVRAEGPTRNGVTYREDYALTMHMTGC